MAYRSVITAAYVVIKVRATHVFDADERIGPAHAVVGAVRSHGLAAKGQARSEQNRLCTQVDDHSRCGLVKAHLVRSGAAIYKVVAGATVKLIIFITANECVIACTTKHLFYGYKPIGAA